MSAFFFFLNFIFFFSFISFSLTHSCAVRRHLGPVNTITFVDNGDRMITTSDDKSIRVW